MNIIEEQRYNFLHNNNELNLVFEVRYNSPQTKYILFDGKRLLLIRDANQAILFTHIPNKILAKIKNHKNIKNIEIDNDQEIIFSYNTTIVHDKDKFTSVYKKIEQDSLF